MKKDGFRAKKMTISKRSFLETSMINTDINAVWSTSLRRVRTKPHARRSPRDFLDIRVRFEDEIHSLTGDNIEEFAILSEHLEPVAELWPPLHDVLFRVGLDLREVAALVGHELSSHEHLLETVQYVRPKEVPDNSAGLTIKDEERLTLPWVGRGC